MRSAYGRHFDTRLSARMRESFPDFQPFDSAARRQFGAPVFYGPGQLSGYFWVPIPPLLMTITFRVPCGDDQFEASCEWSESGKIVKEQPLLDQDLQADETFRLPYARTRVQELSSSVGDGERERVFFWKFWRPSVDTDDRDRWFAEVLADDARTLTDSEAFARVDGAVRHAMNDIRRLVIPWLEKKLAHYKSVHVCEGSCICANWAEDG